MQIDAQMMDALELLERERGVPVEAILDALANALVSAYKRSPGAAEEARVTIDPDSGEIIVYAQDLDEDGNVVKEWEDTPDDFGRIAAQTAKQVIQQRLRDVKREQVFDLYEGREGDLVTGIVQQIDNRFSILDLGDAEAIMPGSERIPYERLQRGNRVKALIVEVRGETKGPQIVVSRSHPDLVRRLLELEVPELADGTVEIVAIAREPGHRTKIAVLSHDGNVDAKGAAVGARGSRVRQVVNELRGEKVDVVQWRDNTGEFIAEALGPARVKDVIIDEEEKTATVIVGEHQLSLAIGKEGQNARLAARLSGYKVDIRSDQEGKEPAEPQIVAEPAPEGAPASEEDVALAAEAAAKAAVTSAEDAAATTAGLIETLQAIGEASSEGGSPAPVVASVAEDGGEEPGDEPEADTETGDETGELQSEAEADETDEPRADEPEAADETTADDQTGDAEPSSDEEE